MSIQFIRIQNGHQKIEMLNTLGIGLMVVVDTTIETIVKKKLSLQFHILTKRKNDYQRILRAKTARNT